MYCPRCGNQNPDGSTHCWQCACSLTAAAGLMNAPAAPRPPAAGGSGIDVIIPYKNAAALTAYYLAVFSLACGPFLGIPALILGLYGLKAVKANPGAHGTVHAWIGIVLGSLTTVASVVLVLWVMTWVRQQR